MHHELTVRAHPLRTIVFTFVLGAIPLSLIYFCSIGLKDDDDFRGTWFTRASVTVAFVVLSLAAIAWVTARVLRSGPVLEIGPAGVRIAHRRRHSPETHAEIPWDYVERIELKGFGPLRTMWFVEAAGRGAAGGHSPTGRYPHQVWLGDRSEREILAALAPYAEESTE